MKTLKVEDITEQMLKELSKEFYVKERQVSGRTCLTNVYGNEEDGEESLVNSPRQDLLQVCIDTISVLKNIIQDLSDQNKRLTNEYQDLGGPTPTNYRPDDNSAKLSLSQNEKVERVCSVFRRKQKRDLNTKLREVEENLRHSLTV